jgi:hypothetical protein
LSYYENKLFEEREKYKSLLKYAASENFRKSSNKKQIPLLDPKELEKIHCGVFKTVNLTEWSLPIDSHDNGIGISIKTFGEISCSQKITELTKEGIYIKGISDINEAAKYIADYRNSKLNDMIKDYNLDKLIYHLITRKKGMFNIHEEILYPIDINSITNISKKNSSIYFQDKYNYYRYCLTKNTLFKNFILDNPIDFIPIKDKGRSYDDIYAEIVREESKTKINLISKQHQLINEKIYLPLYSGTESGKYIPAKSQLNYRLGDKMGKSCNNVYLNVPNWIKSNFKNFFPKDKSIFKVILPNGDILDAKLSQSGLRALMSVPSTDLGEYILREVLCLKTAEESVTFENLSNIGFDSISLLKQAPNVYCLSFEHIGAYEEFELMNKYQLLEA